MRVIITNPAFPRVLQILTAFLLGVVLFFLFIGSPSDEANPGSYMLWYLWWALIPLTFIVLGRMWCSICPVGFFTELAQKIMPKRPLQWPLTLRRYEIIILAFSLLGIHFLNLWFNFEENIRHGGILILLLVVLSCLLALLFQKRIWCRTLCPLGAFAGVMANVAIFRLKINREDCRKPCAGTVCSSVLAEGKNECPMGVDVSRGIDPYFCSACGKCLKDCQRGSITTSWQFPPRIFKPATPSAQVALAILFFAGMSLDMSFYYLVDRPIILWRLSEWMGVTPSSLFELTIHAIIVIFPAIWLLVLASLGNRQRSFPERFGDLARPALPLAALVVIALNLRPLLIAGPMNLKSILLNAGYHKFVWLDNVRYLDGAPLEVIQMIMVGLGIVLALREIRRVKSSKPVLIAAIISYAIFGATFLWLFHQPMFS